MGYSEDSIAVVDTINSIETKTASSEIINNDSSSISIEIIDTVDINKEGLFGEPEKSNEVIITFDDGFSDTYTVAAPIMQNLGIPFIVFV